MKREKYVHAQKRGVCNSCNSQYETVRQAIKAAELAPDKYLSCGDCDRIFKKQQGGRYPKLRTCCPFCKSEELERY